MKLAMRPGRTDLFKRIILKERQTNPPTTFCKQIIVPDAAFVNPGAKSASPLGAFRATPSRLPEAVDRTCSPIYDFASNDYYYTRERGNSLLRNIIRPTAAASIARHGIQGAGEWPAALTSSG